MSASSSQSLIYSDILIDPHDTDDAKDFERATEIAYKYSYVDVA